MMENDFIAASANIEELDPDAGDANIIRERIDDAGLNVVMSNSFGFGGTNATLAFQRHGADPMAADARAPEPAPTPATHAGTGSLMAGKRGLIMGVANDHSIAWGIAQAAAAQGAELAFTYQTDSFARRVGPLAESVNAAAMVQCDASDIDSLDKAFGTIGDTWDNLDFVVHAIAFSDKEELRAAT